VQVNLFGQFHASYINTLCSCYIVMELVLPLHNVFMCVTGDTSWWSVLNLNYKQKGGITVPPPLGCPPLVSAPICPITSVIHPKSDPTRCVTVLGTAVKAYVAYVNHPNDRWTQIYLHSLPCNGLNNQRFLFNQEVWTRIRAAGTNTCLDSGEYLTYKLIT